MMSTMAYPDGAARKASVGRHALKWGRICAHEPQLIMQVNDILLEALEVEPFFVMRRNRVSKMTSVSCARLRGKGADSRICRRKANVVGDDALSRFALAFDFPVRLALCCADSGRGVGGELCEKLAGGRKRGTRCVAVG